jgi:hypothetical protein
MSEVTEKNSRAKQPMGDDGDAADSRGFHCPGPICVHTNILEVD